MDVFIFSINIVIIVSFITKKMWFYKIIFTILLLRPAKIQKLDYLDLPRKKNMKN